MGSVEVISAETFLARTMMVSPDDTSRSGYLKTLTAPKGKAFLVVWTKLKPKWGKDEDGDSALILRDNHILLKDSKGNASHVVGYCTRDGRYYETQGWLSETEEYFDGDRMDYNPVFVVPEEEQEFTLQLAATTHKVTAPMKVENRIPSTRVGTFKIDSVRVLKDIEEVRSLRRYSDHEVKGIQERIITPASSYVVVKFIIKPRMPNDNDGDFYVYSNQFGLRYGSQVYVTPIGYFDDGDFSDGYTGVGDEPDAAGEFRAEVLELVYPLPGRITAFRAMYMMQEFAGAAIPQE